MRAVQEDKEQFSNAVRSEVKATGLMDTPENLWDFFIEKARTRAWLPCPATEASGLSRRC